MQQVDGWRGWGVGWRWHEEGSGWARGEEAWGSAGGEEAWGVAMATHLGALRAGGEHDALLPVVQVQPASACILGHLSPTEMALRVQLLVPGILRTDIAVDSGTRGRGRGSSC